MTYPQYEKALAAWSKLEEAYYGQPAGAEPHPGPKPKTPKGYDEWVKAGRPQGDYSDANPYAPSAADTHDPYAGTIASLQAQFPWITTLGMWDMVEEAIRDDETWEQVYARVTQSTPYKRMFAGMLDSRGVRRFASEREYLNTIDDYRNVLRQYGVFDPTNDDSADYAGLVAQGILPQELERRFQVYKQLEEGSQDLIDSFYVYSGLEITVDDLYRSVTSTEYRTAMESAYNQTIAGKKLNYEAFITRATKRGIQRTVEALQRMRTLGLLTGAVVAEMQSIDPDFARQMMGALFRDSGATGTQLSVSELVTAFEYAMIGSAASEEGLAMPTKERIAELRQAGVDRSRAIQGYGRYAAQRNLLEAAAARSNIDFDQSMFEEAVFLARGGASRDLSRILGREAAFGQAGGNFQQRMTDDGRLEQVGRNV